MQPLIDCQQVNKIVSLGTNALQILHDINLSIMPQEIIAITGVSGAGKSTLLSLLSGLDIPTSGHIYFNGHDLAQLNEDKRAQLRARQVSFIFQNFQLLPSLTALENVMLPLELLNIENGLEKARHWLNRVGLTDRLKHFPKQLSGGEQQRVAIARAFAIEPRVLFADEPTGSLDQSTAQHIIELLQTLHQSAQATLVIVTHDNHVANICQRQIHLDSGRLA
ncbi:MAG: ABC transporter ATP-binding protein [Gammaproteobacteria bacterium]